MENEEGGSRLPEQLRRERLLDMERRLVRHRRAAFGVLAIALLACGPFLGWWFLIPLGVAILTYQVTDRLMQRSDRPEIWAATGWAVSPLMIALSVALTGGADSPGIAWFAIPAVTLAPRFERRGVVFG